MTVKFITLGCKVNQYESQAMLEQLLGQGFQPAGSGPADLVVVNSCTVTAQSDQKARQALRRAKRQNPGAIGVLTGCWPQAFPQEAGAFPDADIVLGNANRAALGQRVMEYLSTKQRVVDIAPHEKGEAFEPMRISGMQGHTRAFLKIEDGCERFCTYCIIPYARGRVRSKPVEQIQAETASLAAAGYREVVLTGINLPAYGQDLGLSLCHAVEAACAIEGVCRVRLGSLEPERLTPPVIAQMRAQPKLCPQFHLSLQSGCGATLKRMNRHYSPKEYMGIVEDLRTAFPGCAITTDVMVGFPGETEAEFAENLAFVEAVGFAKAHVFAYSRRPGTVADRAPDQVSPRVKEERSRRMIAAAEMGRRAFFLSQIGQRAQVLFEQEAEPGVWEGFTPNYTPVLVKSPESLAGVLREAELTGLQGDAMTGELLP
ncbi:MAG: tRNA (N(6)-L-threonylcarbamoyladenosine(37)-C(2))-methylthiotransferase MtaB [Acutalibacter sp.]|nr:tRNA (N(6)-L-threonylcarbamoyladenosine(37)-C(2))-methylthiotransferase MtaB [Acutalibacter sp.]